jgi:hypothetical protein
MSFPQRNHYNPCFWTALWNVEYFEAFRNGTECPGPARKQIVSAANLKSGSVFPTSVERVHYDKGIGEAEMTREAVEDFCRRNQPDYYDEFCRRNETAKYPVWINLEDLLTAAEKMLPYEVLMAVAARGSIESAEEKVALAMFVYFHLLRSHAILNAVLESHAERGVSKFETFITLKSALSDEEFLMRAAESHTFAYWRLYRTKEHTFPLGDAAVLVGSESTMVALSPRLLLEISMNRRASEYQWDARNGVKPGKLAEYRRRTINSSFREIIFHDSETLQFWKSTREFGARMSAIRNMTSYRELMSSQLAMMKWPL